VWRGGPGEKGKKDGWRRRWELEVEEEVELREGIGRRWRQRWRRKGQGVIRRRSHRKCAELDKKDGERGGKREVRESKGGAGGGKKV